MVESVILTILATGGWFFYCTVCSLERGLNVITVFKTIFYLYMACMLLAIGGLTAYQHYLDMYA
ncbi:hypothetical protein [Delftia phage PhiW-14]|uniref:Uncharacterized protein n=1 Tax=Delftia phage PhiW-14 TaxID=665032 RepID=C9DG96_BPW14|nr:hypothetical protein DP-phiW-14_gp126 [Delftia phage PhiW-14]ACV50147.1 hypothetical protein [Delftia phage PhiW-14]